MDRRDARRIKRFRVQEWKRERELQRENEGERWIDGAKEYQSEIDKKISLK